MKKLILLLLLVPIVGFSQNNQEKDSLHIEYDEIKRFSAGIKFGFPYMAVVGAQYTLPFFNNHFAPYFDYSQYSYVKNDDDAEFRFSEFGLSYFFKEISNGIYLGLSNSNLSYKVNFMNIDLENGSKGSGSGKVDMRTTNVRFGFKTGGSFYFRIEIGYGLGDIPNMVIYKAIDNFNSSYSETRSKMIPEINGISESDMFVGNIGLGVSF